MLTENRGAGHLSLAVDATCRLRGVSHVVRLYNMSKAGCCTEANLPGAAAGDRVILQLTELLVLPATILWVSDGRAGLLFTSPLHGAMLCEFAKRKSTVADIV